MDKAEATRAAYVREVIRSYSTTPCVVGRIRRSDRELAGRLFDRGVPLYAVLNAFLIAAARRVRHNAFASALPAIRSLHYFEGVIDEMLTRPPGPRDMDECRRLLGLGEPPL